MPPIITWLFIKIIIFKILIEIKKNNLIYKENNIPTFINK